MLPHVGRFNSAHHGLLHLSFNIHSSNWFSCSIKFFHLKKSPWASFGRILAVVCATTEKLMSPKAYFLRKAFLGKPVKKTFVENKDVNSTHASNLDGRLYNNSCAPASEEACAMGRNTMALIQTCQIQAIMTVPQRLSFSAQLSNCNVATCWQIKLIISHHTAAFPPFFHWENWFSMI